MKNYLRDRNINFSLSDARRLAYQWITSLNRTTAMGYISETRKIEDVFKKSDRFMEEIEEQLYSSCYWPDIDYHDTCLAHWCTIAHLYRIATMLQIIIVNG